MRITLKFDSTSTAEIRRIARGLHRAGRTGELKVGLNGPEQWSAETPPLTPQELAFVTQMFPGWHR